jgi:hypothetical protein
MPKYSIDMRVDYTFEIEADTPEEAESLAWEYDYVDDFAAYAGVYSIEVEEVEEDEDAQD